MKFLLLIILALSSVSLFAETEAEKIKALEDGGYYFGQDLGNYRGVVVHNNYHAGCKTMKRCHSSSDTGSQRSNYGLKWQCVEFVNRFYSEGMHVPVYYRMNAVNFLHGTSDKFLSYSNGSNNKPRIDDTLVFDTGDGIGHVAVITEVNDTYILTAQQNNTLTEADVALRFPIEYKNGGWTVKHPQVTGWIRLKPDQCQKTIDYYGEDAILGCKACTNDAKTVNEDGSPQVAVGTCRTQTELKGRKLIQDTDGCYRNVPAAECGKLSMDSGEVGCSMNTNNSNFPIFLMIFFISFILIRRKKI